MKILLVTFSDNSDHQDTLFGLYEQLRKESKDVYLLAISTPKVSLETSEHTWLVDCPKRPGITKQTLNMPVLFSIINRIKAERFDAIYFESLHTWNLPIMMSVGNKTHTYQVIHEVIPHEGDKQVKMVDLMNKAVCKLSDTIVLRNKTYINDMIQRYHIAPERVKYLELWRRYPLETLPKHQKRVLFFGRINPYKGADNLLQIVRQCPEIQFDVIGRVDAQMETIIESLRKESNAFLNNDYVSDDEMRNAFVNCDWAIVPYNSASQSGIIIDAYKYSRPVIAFDVGAIAEQIDDKKSGYLVPAGNISAFVTTLKAALQLSDDDYKKMCHYAYQFGSEKYAAAGAVGRFMEVLKNETN